MRRGACLLGCLEAEEERGVPREFGGVSNVPQEPATSESDSGRRKECKSVTDSSANQYLAYSVAGSCDAAASSVASYKFLDASAISTSMGKPVLTLSNLTCARRIAFSTALGLPLLPAFDS